MFTGEESENPRPFPEIGREELFWFFTLSPVDFGGLIQRCSK